MIEFAGERRGLTKNDMHLTWKLSGNIVIVCVSIAGRVLSEMFDQADVRSHSIRIVNRLKTICDMWGI